ncbi:unnamed protein product [Pleuronectes platessa]|uniref:Uncharacterized protein n=1 Tax=Pleuronectes platessa TaxID=8262 RepID=A0A9N7TWX2_PLEPL|nr:unnamed protein product [Pleuronectes platessa]
MEEVGFKAHLAKGAVYLKPAEYTCKGVVEIGLRSNHKQTIQEDQTETTSSKGLWLWLHFVRSAVTTLTSKQIATRAKTNWVVFGWPIKLRVLDAHLACLQLQRCRGGSSPSHPPTPNGSPASVDPLVIQLDGLLVDELSGDSSVQLKLICTTRLSDLNKCDDHSAS